MKGKIMAIVILIIVFFIMLPEPTPQQAGLSSNEKSKSAYSESFLIRDVRMYDGNQLFKEVDVSIVDFRIFEIADELPAQTKFPELDGKGKTLLPGLIDAHTHAYQNALSEALNFGVTTELDMFTMPEFAGMHIKQRDLLENHSNADLFSSTILATAPGGHGTEYGFDIPTLTSPEQTEQFVLDRISEGADYIKAVYSSEKSVRKHFPSISKTILAALIESAHKQNKLLVVHVDDLVSARESISLGADGIIHSFMDKVVDQEFVQLMVENKAFIVPTLKVQSSVTNQFNTQRLLDSQFNLEFLTKQQVQQLEARFPDFGIPPQALQNAFNSVKLLADANVAILAGSDAPNPGTTHGLSLHAELELLVKAGLTNEQAIHAATGAVGQRYPVGKRGTLSKGVLASMILIDGNPFKEITDSQKIARIWKNGSELNRLTFDHSSSTTDKFKAGLITDFSQHLNKTEIGTGLGETTDKITGGQSVVQLTLVNSDEKIDSNNQHLQVSGEVKQGFMFPWSGFAYLLGKDMQSGVDLSGLESITFKAKSSSQTSKLSVLLFQTGSFRPVQRDIELSNTWQTYRVNFSELSNLDLTDMANISFVRSQVIGEFEFMIDDIRFE